MMRGFVCTEMKFKLFMKHEPLNTLHLYTYTHINSSITNTKMGWRAHIHTITLLCCFSVIGTVLLGLFPLNGMDCTISFFFIAEKLNISIALKEIADQKHRFPMKTNGWIGDGSVKQNRESQKKTTLWSLLVVSHP